jgi:magnesium-transporting ATPase (P-type)
MPDRQEPWHAQSVDKALERIESSRGGLTREQAESRLQDAGPNTLQTEEGTAPWRLLFRQQHNMLEYQVKYDNETGIRQTVRAYVDKGWI